MINRVAQQVADGLLVVQRVAERRLALDRRQRKDAVRLLDDAEGELDERVRRLLGRRALARLEDSTRAAATNILAGRFCSASAASSAAGAAALSVAAADPVPESSGRR